MQHESDTTPATARAILAQEYRESRANNKRIRKMVQAGSEADEEFAMLADLQYLHVAVYELEHGGIVRTHSWRK